MNEKKYFNLKGHINIIKERNVFLIFQKQKTVLHFMCYSPRIYSALDRFTLVLATELQKKGYSSVFVYNDEIGVKELEIDILKTGAKVELLKTIQGKAKTIGKILLLLKKYHPRIVHAHFEIDIKTILSLVCFLFGIHFYFSNHSLIAYQTATEYRKEKGMLKTYRLKLHLKLLLFLCDKSFCVSEAVRKQFVDYSGVDSSKLQKLYLGVKINPEKLNKKILRKKLNLSLNKVLIVNISAIEYIKGIDIIIKAIVLLREKYQSNNFQFIHVGGLRSDIHLNLQYEHELKALQKELLCDSDYFIWFGKRNDVYNILAACDIYVHPSRKEGLPTTIMEACSAYLPSVGSKVGGIPEIIQNNINGFLVEPENEIQLAEALNKLISDEILRDEMGRKAFLAVKEKWNIEKQVLKLIEAYRV
ncbi:MAG: glycosyltransferase family 4 protein [Bacteroidetes bacterium]|nr:glycosyltransferase family 4 protein [Bacteroidota bacterium]